MSAPSRAPAQVKEITRVTLAGAVVNLALAVSKVVAGLIGQSQALIADGIHSLSDLASDAVVYLASKRGSRGPDREHPYGHARIETAATVAMGVLLVLVAVGLVGDGARRLLTPEPLPTPAVLALWMALFSILVKEGMYHYTLASAKRVGSDLLRANAWHHRSDAASSVIVLVAVGGSLLGWRWLDAAGAMLVALMIAWIGWDLAWRSVRELVDTGLDPAEVENIRKAIMTVDGVAALHLLRTRRMGGKALVDVHILLQDPRISVSEGHQISEAVLAQLVKTIDEVTDVTVHIDPEDDERVAPSRGLPLRAALLARLQRYWEPIEAARDIQKVNLHYLNGKIYVEVLLPVSLADDPARSEALCDAFAAAVKHDPEIGEVRLLYY